ncbi:MAG: hypothetical protein HDT25_03420 [Ruminococcus sp.]|nr:hypothetical protein [Ruminococcus sp.]
MKKLFSALILCAAMLCGCSENDAEEISEAAVQETSLAATVTETETAKTITTTTTAKETTVTETAEEEIILTPIPSKEPFEIPYCRVIDDLAIESEENFRSGEAIKRAREICFEKAHKEIERYNDNYEYAVETAEDIVFSSGLAYDFDHDGSDEYVIALDYAPLSPMDGGFLILMDGSEYTVDTFGCGDISAKKMEIIFCENLYFPIVTFDGATAQSRVIYTFENNKPQKVLHPNSSGGPHSITYENGIFYLTHKYEDMAEPFILCGDGVFRQLGREKITREDFEAHVRDGGRYIDSLSENGEEITDIYTCGYYSYRLCGEDFCYELYSPLFGENKGKFLAKRSDNVPDEAYFVSFTDELVYGDVWAVQTTRSLDYDIGGGYVCYKTGKSGSRILNVVKDNFIIDSINLSDENLSFDPDWQINFYDMDTPPCFALEVHGIDYRTYFVIDGKITEMNWTLDGEPLDTVDYTMLKCRGVGDEFVSYSIPIWENDRFTKRHFTFEDGDYTNIVGYTEDIDDKITKEYNDNLHGYVKHGTQLLDEEQNAKIAYEIIRKFDGFWDDAYHAERSYVEDEFWLCQIEEEGFRTKEEIMKTISEFCTPAASEEVYSKLIEGSSDFKIIDGRVYLYDEAPSNYLPYYFIESAEEKDGVITAKIFAYYSGQDIPYWICPPLYAEFVREDGVWKISSLPKEK